MRRFASLFYTLQGHWPWLARAGAWLRQDIGNAILFAPFEPILHASRWRLGWIGAFTMIGHPLFAWIWTYWLPQPWESIWLRFVLALLGLLLLIAAAVLEPQARIAQVLFNIVLWIELPLLFSWMYLCNGGNAVWLASAVAMVLIYYHLIDWRIATGGVALGGVVAWLLFGAIGPAVPMNRSDMATGTAVLGFSWVVAIALGFSTANQRRINLKQTLTTMGIMAHELRTPLATVSLISQALRGIAQSDDARLAGALDPLADRLASLVRNMNHQIDTQIANARLLRLAPLHEPIQAGALVKKVVADFPFRGDQERRIVAVRVLKDFVFSSSPALFAQVTENLLKNALKATHATDRPPAEGEIAIEVSASGGRGTLAFSDRGVGIAPALRQRIFEPFFSSDSHTGHGLGLAFCKRAVHSAGGSIRVESVLGRGATFYIELPAEALSTSPAAASPDLQTLS